MIAPAFFSMELLDGATTAFITLFVVVDPIGLAPIFIALTAGRSAMERRRIAFTSVAIAAAVLALFALAGEATLALLGIGLPAFRISGGLMLFLIALEMLFERRNERRTKTAQEAEEHAAEHAEDDVADPTVFPLATPLLAGPGAMASMILLASSEDGAAARAVVLVCAAAVLLICLALFLVSGVIERALGPSGVRLVTRLLGVLLGALAVQFVLDGLADFGFVAKAAG